MRCTRSTACDGAPAGGVRCAVLARARLQLTLIALFAALALSLAGIGLYGVIAYAVEQRRQELGLRLAVGATPAMVTRLVVYQGLLLAAAGLAAGALVAILALPALRALLYDVALTDPVAAAGAGLFILLVALAACVQPARRAARIAPMTALRTE
ncbi:MAG: FtsX-like permease family protein [Vicinamibacteraceae bacterium]